MTHELAKTLTTALVQFIDREIPEGSMCCSSAECERIEKAFEGGTYDVVEKLIKKKLSGLTEFEEGLVTFYNKRNEIPSDKDGVYNKHDLEGFLHESAKTLLELAKKELARLDEVITLNNLPPYDKGFQDGKAEAMADLERTFECNPEKLPEWLKNELERKHLEGYTKGFNDAEKKYNESAAYHFPIMPTPPSGWGCDGTHCTNPHFDCINCPRQFTGNGEGTITSTNTASGTSTLKAKGQYEKVQSNS